MKHTFSIYVKQNVPTLVRRPWWNLLGRDRIELKKQWVRRSFCDLNGAQALLFQHAGGFQNTNWGKLFLRAMGEEFHSTQLERQQDEASKYVITEAASK